MTTDGYGDVNLEGERPEVEFERVLDAAIEVVWAMLTTDEGLARWLAPASVDLRVGGSMDIDFGSEVGVVGGEIIELTPSVAIEYRWLFTGEPDSVIRFELEMVDSGATRLRLRHRLLPTDEVVGYGAGWHAHLDQLAHALSANEPFDWEARFAALMPEYQSLVA